MFRLGNVLWCVLWGGGGGGGYVCLCDVKSKCRLRQLLVAVSLCSGLVTYCGVCCGGGGGGGGGGGYVCLCDVKSKCRFRQLLVAVMHEV